MSQLILGRREGESIYIGDHYLTVTQIDKSHGIEIQVGDDKYFLGLRKSIYLGESEVLLMNMKTTRQCSIAIRGPSDILILRAELEDG